MRERWMVLAIALGVYLAAVLLLILYQHEVVLLKLPLLLAVGASSFWILLQLLRMATKSAPQYTRAECIAARIILFVLSLGTLVAILVNLRSIRDKLSVLF